MRVRIIRNSIGGTGEQDGGAVGMLLAELDPVAPAAKTGGVAMTQHELGQAFVEVAALPDLFALVEDGPRDAIERAGEGGVAQPADAVVERGVPRNPETLRIDPAAQRVGGGRCLADAFARRVDARAFGERIDEIGLAFERPPVVARAGGHGGEHPRLGGGLPRASGCAGASGCAEAGGSARASGRFRFSGSGHEPDRIIIEACRKAVFASVG